MKTQMEIWIGKPADYSSLYMFECLAYVMYNIQERIKMNPKSRNCIFLRYVDDTKGYRVWDPTIHKVIISRDVIFVDDELQRKVNDNTFNKPIEITIVQMENKSKIEDSFEVEIEHGEQKPIKTKVLII